MPSGIYQRKRKKRVSSESRGSAEGKPALSCPFCSKPFTSRPGLDVHVRWCKAAPSEEARAAQRPVAVAGAVEVPAPAPPAAPVSELPVEVLEIAFASTFDLLASRGGEHWRLRVAEAKSLGQCWKAVLDYYWPSVGPRVLLVAVAETALILGPKVVAHAQKVGDRKRGGEGNQGGSDDSGPGRERENNNAPVALEPVSSSASV